MKHRDMILLKRCSLTAAILVFVLSIGSIILPNQESTRSVPNIERTLKKAEIVSGLDVKPWMKKKEYELILKYLLPRYDMLEWGAGKSSCIWSVFVNTLLSIEHNVKWAETVRENLQKNQKIIGVPRNTHYKDYRIRTKPTPAHPYDNYLHPPELVGRKFDAILIDGRARPQCAFEALSLLKSKNSVVFIHDYYSDIPDRRYYHIVEKWYTIVESITGTPGMVVLRPKNLYPEITEFPEWWFENLDEDHHPIRSG